MRQYLAFVLAVAVVASVHEGAHALMAVAFGEYGKFHIRPFGLEVEYSTPVANRAGVKWAFISGTSCIVTLLLGYVLLAIRKRIARLGSKYIKLGVYYLTFLFLVVDPLSMSIGPFVFGGDIGGLVAAFHVNRYLVQTPFLILLLVNRELIAQRLLPDYGIVTKHPLFRPWFKLR